jgi:hypothetical protein
LPIGDDVDVAVLWKKPLQRPQAVAQLLVVSKATLHVGVQGHGSPRVLAQRGQSRCPPGAPIRIVTVHPQVDHIEGVVWCVGPRRWGRSGTRVRGVARPSEAAIFQPRSLSVGGGRYSQAHDMVSVMLAYVL